jgi:hypothetical protein
VVGAQAMVVWTIRFDVQGGEEQDRRPAAMRTALGSVPIVPRMLPGACSPVSVLSMLPICVTYVSAVCVALVSTS